MQIRLPNRFPEYFEVDGIQLPLKRMPLDSRSKRRILRGGYEMAERKLVAQFLKEGDHVLEFGASLGVMSSIIAKLVGDQGRVVSVEPDESLRPAFDAQMELNGLDVECIAALGCPIWADEVPPEWGSKRFSNQGHALSGRAESAPEGCAVGKTQWKTARQICKEADFEPNALIIDIEGAETVWCQHVPNLPKTVDRMIVEFHPEISGERLSGQAVQSIIKEGFAVAGFSGTVLAFRREG